jgi:hypothetical protein
MGIGKRLPSRRSDKSLSVDTGYYRIISVSPSVDTSYNRMVEVRTARSVSLFGFNIMRQSRRSQRDIGGIIATFKVMFASSMHRHGLCSNDPSIDGALPGGAQPNEDSHLSTTERGVVCG